MTTFRSSGKLVYSFKSPLTISGTSSRWIAVRVVGDSGQVKMDDNPFAGGSSDHQTDPAEVAALESDGGMRKRRNCVRSVQRRIHLAAPDVRNDSCV